MRRKTWMSAIAVVLVTGIAIKLARRSPAETPQQQVRRLLCEMAYQPGDLDFGWSGRPFDQADAEMKGLGIGVMPHVINCLDDPSRLVRRQAVRRLDIFGDRRAVPALISALSDPDGEVCREAMKALIGIAPQEAVEPIIGVLSHRDWYARWEAVRSLATLGDRRAIDPLRRIHQSEAENESTRQEAAKALRRLGVEVPPLLH